MVISKDYVSGRGGKDAENSPQRRRFLPPNHRYRDLCGKCDEDHLSP